MNLTVIHLTQVYPGDKIQFTDDAAANVYEVDEVCKYALLWCDHGEKLDQSVKLNPDNTAYRLTEGQANTHRLDEGFRGKA